VKGETRRPRSPRPARSALGIPDRLSPSARGLLATPEGAVACELEPTGIDAAGAHYELRITNGTPGVLAARASAVRVAKCIRSPPLRWRSSPTPRSGPVSRSDSSLAYERVTAEVHGEGIHLVVDAPPPRGGPAATALGAPVIAVGAAGLLAGAVLILFGAEAAARRRRRAAGESRRPAGWRAGRDRNRDANLRAGATRAAQSSGRGRCPGRSGTLDLGRGDGGSLRVRGRPTRSAAIPVTPPTRARRAAGDPDRHHAAPAIGSITVDPPPTRRAPDRSTTRRAPATCTCRSSTATARPTSRPRRRRGPGSFAIPGAAARPRRTVSADRRAR